jgi:hypothetical protein
MFKRELIGREYELNALRNGVDALKRGHPVSIFVSGRFGLGKTEIMRYMFTDLFDQQDVYPLFYSVKTGFTSVETFAKDYFNAIIKGILAYMRKDRSMLAGIYSISDLREIARRMELEWMEGIINDFEKILLEGDSGRLLSYAVNIPVRIATESGKPVVVLIDDFHKLCRHTRIVHDAGGFEIWASYQDVILAGGVLHIITGNHAVLSKAFFEDSSIGYDLEVLYLRPLEDEQSTNLFKHLCERSGLTHDTDTEQWIRRLGGNPFYIKSIVQAARQVTEHLRVDTLEKIYSEEASQRRLFTYWISHLRNAIPQFELRRPTLQVLSVMLGNGGTMGLEDISRDVTIEQDVLTKILDHLERGGIIETGFSTITLVRDNVFRDVLNTIIEKEIGISRRREPAPEPPQQKEEPEEVIPPHGIDLRIPAAEKAELVAVRSLEQIAHKHGIPSEVIGKLQMAIIELFSSLLPGSETGAYRVRFIPEDGIFRIEIETDIPGIDPSRPENERVFNMIRSYVNDFSITQEGNLTKIVLIKNI